MSTYSAGAMDQFSVCEEGCATKLELTKGSVIPKAALGNCTDGSTCIKMSNLYSDSPAPVPVDTPVSNIVETSRKLAAELLGTAILLNLIVGSGTMAETLSTDVGLQLLENGISVGAGLVGLILMFGPVSGAHFNPVVSLVDYLFGDMSLRDVCLYSICQVIGAILGAMLADAQFNHTVSFSTKERDAHHLWLGEVIATVTLLLVIHGCLRTGQKTAVPYAVGLWVLAGHFFTSSTIFANPAVTIGRQFSDTFAGIDPSSVGPFVGFQFLGALVAFGMIKFFYPTVMEIHKDDNLYLRVCISRVKDKVE